MKQKRVNITYTMVLSQNYLFINTTFVLKVICLSISYTLVSMRLYHNRLISPEVSSNFNRNNIIKQMITLYDNKHNQLLVMHYNIHYHISVVINHNIHNHVQVRLHFNGCKHILIILNKTNHVQVILCQSKSSHSGNT